MKKELTVRDRKNLAKLKNELKKMEDKAYRLNVFADYEDRFNDRYNSKVNAINKLECK